VSSPVVTLVEVERRHRGFSTWSFFRLLACTVDEARKEHPKFDQLGRALRFSEQKVETLKSAVHG
jgi:hypothetical protein